MSEVIFLPTYYPNMFLWESILICASLTLQLEMKGQSETNLRRRTVCSLSRRFLLLVSYIMSFSHDEMQPRMLYSTTSKCQASSTYTSHQLSEATLFTFLAPSTRASHSSYLPFSIFTHSISPSIHVTGKI